MDIAKTGEAGAIVRRLFLEKAVAAVLLVALADFLFFLQPAGATFGLFALALLLVLAGIANPLRLGRPALAAFAAALLLGAIQIEDPSPLAAALFWAATSLAVLLPRGRFDDGWRWSLRLLHHGGRSLLGPLGDWRRLRAARTRARHGRPGIARHLRSLLLPLLGTVLFLGLFAAANPLIGNALAAIDLAALLGALSIARILFWLAAALLLWPLLRPRLLVLRPPAARAEPAPIPGVDARSVTLSLLAFNLLFGLQNGLDLVFLWSGASLPKGMTLADYAHRGAYPLIATALLAGLFVLVALRPGSPLARSAAIRRLVYLWIGQNVLLVASTLLRTLDYVEAYSLTRLRIAALLWMGQIALGLVLICWRIARGRSGAWLINANFAAALLVLASCSFVDLGAVAAAWNVGHARETGGRGAALDLCYIDDLGASALLPMIALERRRLSPGFRERLAWKRNLLMDRLENVQADWHGWTFRNARRLAAARHLMAENRLPRFTAGRRPCDGAPPPALTGPAKE
jgi:hypothetical protein